MTPPPTHKPFQTTPTSPKANQASQAHHANHANTPQSSIETFDSASNTADATMISTSNGKSSKMKGAAVADVSKMTKDRPTSPSKPSHMPHTSQMPQMSQMSQISNAMEYGLEDMLLGSQMHPNFDTVYTVQRELMSGSYGTVYAAVHNMSRMEYAVKIVDRAKLSKSDDESQLREVEILRYLASSPPLERQSSEKSKNSDTLTSSVQSNESSVAFTLSEDEEDKNDNGIINLIDFYSAPETYHMVMELAKGGDVFDRLAKRKIYTEKDARDLARRMLESIQFLHERGVAHRDIKPENLLLMDEEDDTQLKLADFGFARHFSPQSPDTSMKTKCGTPAFVPPELVSGFPYGPKCDIWSAGCTLFMLLSGRAPFRVDGAGGKNGMYYKIRAGDYVFYDDYWGHISMDARKLVMSMMQVDPKVRVSAAEALKSEWILTDGTILRRSSLEKSLKEIISFNARRKLKGAISAVMYAAGGKFWNIERTSIWRECLYDSDAAVIDESEKGGYEVDQEAARGRDSVLAHPVFQDLYEVESEIRAGKHATVCEGRAKDTGKQYAIKIVDRENLTTADEGAVLNEVAMLKSLRHKHIVPLLDFFEDPQRFYLVMYKCNGGDVLDRIASIKRYSEKDAREFSKGLLEGIEFIHRRGIAHRDLKPQNLLLENDADNVSLKICDFGYAKRVHMPQSMTTLCGSPHYVAPELLKNHPYDESADMWSVGVIIYFLLVGYLPFYSKDQRELFQLIRLGKFRYDSKYWANISDEAKSLINRLLEVDPTHRETATQGLQCDWINKVEDVQLEDHKLENTQTVIVKERRRLKSVVRAVQWARKSKTISSISSFSSSSSS